MSTKKKIVMACTHHLGSPFQVGSQNIRKELLREGHEVLYISAPITPFHFLGRKNKDLHLRWKVCRSKSNLEIIPFTTIAPHHVFPFNTRVVLKNWLKTNLLPFVKKIHALGYFEPDLLYVDNIFYHQLIDTIRPQKIVFRVMDFHPGFPGWKTNDVVPLAKKITDSADLTVYTAKSLKTYVENQLGSLNCVYLSNGISIDFMKRSKRLPQDLKNLLDAENLIVYVGALDDWIDWHLVEYLSKNLNKGNFVFFGPKPSKKVLNRFSSFKNISFPGYLPKEFLAHALNAAKIGIIPFDVKANKELVQHINPLKLYEYLLAGLPVISTYWQVLEEYSDLICTANTKEEFGEYILKILEERKKYIPDKAIVLNKIPTWDEITKKMMTSLEQV